MELEIKTTFSNINPSLSSLSAQHKFSSPSAQLAAASGNDEVLTSRLTELKSLMKEQEDAGQAVRASLSAAEQRIRALEDKDTDLRIDQVYRGGFVTSIL